MKNESIVEGKPLISKKQKTDQVELLGVPFSILPDNLIDRTVNSFVRDGKPHLITLIDFKAFKKARKSRKIKARLRAIAQTGLVLPCSRSLAAGIKYLKKPALPVYAPFDLVIKLLGAIERINGTIYIIGGTNNDLNLVTSNLRDSFPGLRILGRFSGYYKKDQEEDVLTAIKKASPNLVLTGTGLKGKGRWVLENSSSFSPGVYIWCGEFFDVICGRKKRIAPEKWERGLWFMSGLFLHPWRIFRCFSYLHYRLLLIINR